MAINYCGIRFMTLPLMPVAADTLKKLNLGMMK
jgi:hypothetical protein